MPLLAETAPPPAELSAWLGVAFYLLGGALVVKNLFFPRQTPQPLKVQTQQDFVTATEHREAIGDIKKELLRHQGRRAEIYETQKQQGAQLAELDAKSDLMNAQLQRQDGKIDRILERLPR